MTSLAITNDYVAATRGLFIDVFNKNHKIINIQKTIKTFEHDYISDITFSPDGKFAAIATSVSKTLLIYEIPFQENHKTIVLPRSSSKIRFTPDSKSILVADKSGDVLIYDIKLEDGGKKILGHLSLLLDVLQTNDITYIISSDRDEKIKVSCYPNTYNIQSFCLGHKEFVNHIELLPHNDKYVTSSSGDGSIKCWNYVEGKLLYTIYTSKDICDNKALEEFSKSMDEEGVDVETLPIVHYSIVALDNNTSIIAVTLHTFDKLLLYSLHTEKDAFSHKLEKKIHLEYIPASIQFQNLDLYIFDRDNNIVNKITVINENGIIKTDCEETIKMFDNSIEPISLEDSISKNIKTLYKRKYDNVQEYLQRKMQRLNKS